MTGLALTSYAKGGDPARIDPEAADLPLRDALRAVFPEGVTGRWESETEFVAVIGGSALAEPSQRFSPSSRGERPGCGISRDRLRLFVSAGAWLPSLPRQAGRKASDGQSAGWDPRLDRQISAAGSTAIAALLADMGAEVVKIEPPQGDAWRGYTLMRAGFPLCPAITLSNRQSRQAIRYRESGDAGGAGRRSPPGGAGGYLHHQLHQPYRALRPHCESCCISASDFTPDHDSPATDKQSATGWVDYARFTRRSAIISLIRKGRTSARLQQVV
ncbi:MAG: CoA transferase [Dehalococcoidia bacterium]